VTGGILAKGLSSRFIGKDPDFPGLFIQSTYGFSLQFTTPHLEMIMSFFCSYRNKNEPTAIYPSLGTPPPGKEKKHM
jgi:hypothetical protein